MDDPLGFRRWALRPMDDNSSDSPDPFDREHTGADVVPIAGPSSTKLSESTLSGHETNAGLSFGSDDSDSFDKAITGAGVVPRGGSTPSESTQSGQETGAGLSFSSEDSDNVDGFERVADVSVDYVDEGSLGKGGMGEVRKIRHRRMGRLQAIKRIKDDVQQNRQALSRFQTEAKVIKSLAHANIVALYDYGCDAEGPFLILEYIDGESLESRLVREGRLDANEAIGLTCQMCDALAHAHEKHIIHRDVKPGNILLTKSGVPKLADFGLARLIDLGRRQTSTGAVLGTWSYMPPEQMDREQADERSDQWSLAATLYRMVVGRIVPTRGDIDWDELPELLRASLRRALKSAREQRFNSILEFKDSLQDARTASQVPLVSVTVSLAVGQCRACGAANNPEYNNCTKCRAKLREPCISCERHVAVWEQFCGYCGADGAEELARRKLKWNEQLSQIDALRREYRYVEALELANALTHGAHPALASYRADGEKLARDLQAEWNDRRHRDAETLLEAQSELDEGRHEEALKLLARIPPSDLESWSEYTKLRDLAEARQREANDLFESIKASMLAKQYDGLLERTARYLELCPHDERISKLHGQLEAREHRKQHKHLMQQQVRFDEAASEIDSLRSKGRLEEAIALATTLLADFPDSFAPSAQNILARLESERNEITAHHQTLYQQALWQYSDGKYDVACNLLAQVPASARENWLDYRILIKKLRHPLFTSIHNDAFAKRHHGLLARTDRFLELYPDDSDVAKLHAQLLNQEQRNRREKFASRREADRSTRSSALDVEVPRLDPVVDSDAADDSDDGTCVISLEHAADSDDEVVEISRDKPRTPALSAKVPASMPAPPGASASSRPVKTPAKVAPTMVNANEAPDEVNDVPGYFCIVFSLLFLLGWWMSTVATFSWVLSVVLRVVSWGACIASAIVCAETRKIAVRSSVLCAFGYLLIWSGPAYLLLISPYTILHWIGYAAVVVGGFAFFVAFDTTLRKERGPRGSEPIDGLAILGMLSVNAMFLSVFFGFGSASVPGSSGQNDGDQPAVNGKQVRLLDDAYVGNVWSENGLDMKFCWCPPGKFTMGSPRNEPDRSDNEGPVPVTLTKGFWLGKYEVTQGEWQRVMGTTVVQQRDKADKTGLLAGEGDAFPMYYVSHDEAVEFCEKLTKQERAAGRLPTGWTYMLPTEAQWEYACRAGTTTATAFGNALSSSQANFDGNFPYNGAAIGSYKEATVRVGSYPSNGWGLCDMHGNLSEWCRDWYADKLSGGTDPQTVLNSMDRVIRGGEWLHAGDLCRSAYRFSESHTEGSFKLGFRVAIVQSSK